MPLRANITPVSAGRISQLPRSSMASASLSASRVGPAVAPWRADFLQHISQMSQASFVLSSLHRLPGGGNAAAALGPRARTCIFRGMWATLPPNELNPAPRNPAVYESDLPVFTTDARMAKVADLGGGAGPVEAVWWVESAQTQWRVRGTAWVLGAGDGDAADGVPAAAKEAITARMRRTVAEGPGGDDEGQWSWARELTAHFGNLSPVMRGTFRNPAPGTPRETPPSPGEGLGQSVEDLEDELARRNFRVCVIVPDEVDRVLLARDDPRRWLYRFVATKAAWETVELWP